MGGSRTTLDVLSSRPTLPDPDKRHRGSPTPTPSRHTPGREDLERPRTEDQCRDGTLSLGETEETDLHGVGLTLTPSDLDKSSGGSGSDTYVFQLLSYSSELPANNLSVVLRSTGRHSTSILQLPQYQGQEPRESYYPNPTRRVCLNPCSLTVTPSRHRRSLVVIPWNPSRSTRPCVTVVPLRPWSKTHRCTGRWKSEETVYTTSGHYRHRAQNFLS